MDGQDNIEALSRHCFRGFDELIKSLANCPEVFLEDMPARTIENDFDRFKIWCGNLGALQRGRSSLDVRLRDSLVMRDTVMRFLGQLQESLKQSIEITTGLRTPWEDLKQSTVDALTDTQKDETSGLRTENNNDEESDTNDEGNSELAEIQSEIQDTITHLYRISFKMRNANYRSSSTRALSIKSVNPETKVDLFSGYAVYDHQYVLESLLQLRQIPQPLTPDLWPIRRMTDSIPTFLLERLSRAMTNRRRYFAYWQKHALKLSRITDEPLVSQENLKTEGLKAESGTDAHERDKLIAKSVRISGPETVLSGTDISKYRSNLDDHLETETVISHATTAKDINGKSAELPPPPAGASSRREFVCPYCRVTCPSWQGKGKSWRTHVLQDLQPYICTFPDCLDGDHLYASRGAWIEHERMCHRRVWRCFEPRHSNVFYKSKEQLRLHLVEDHVDLAELQIQSFLGLTETTAADGRGVCPFCDSAGPFDKGLYNHMAFHQETLATFAAPRNVDEDGSDEANSGKAHGTRSTGSLRSISLHFSDVSDASVGLQNVEVGDELYTASRSGNGEVLKLLLNQGVNVNAQGGQYANALQAASYGGHKEVVELLIAHGANINAQGGQYANALQAASSNGYEQIVRLLLDAGADVNVQGGHYANALQAATFNNNEAVTKLLLEKGANLIPEGGNGRTPPSMATENRHEDISMSNMASMYINQRRWKEAEELEIQVIQTRKSVLGEQHPDTITSVSDLGLTLLRQGKYEEAEAMYQRALSSSEKLLGAEHLNTISRVSDLGLTLLWQGKYEEAEAINRRALSLSEKVLGPEHLDTISRVSNLGLTLFRQGKYEEAEAMYQRALSSSEKLLGAEHPSTIFSLANLASTYRKQGRWEEAETMDVQVLEQKKRHLGEEHPDTLDSMANLARTWKSQGRLKEAILMMERCFELREQVLGPSHPSTELSLKYLPQWQREMSEIDV